MDRHEQLRACERLERSAQQSFFEEFKDSMMVVCLRYAKNEAQANDFLLGTFKLFFNNFVAPAAKVEDIEAWVKTQFINELVVLILANKQEYKIVSTALPQEELVPQLTLTNEELLPLIHSPKLLPAVQSLPTAYRLILNLLLVDGFEIKKIEDKLDIGEAMIRLNLEKVIHLLRKNLSEGKTNSYGQ